jgi:8-oxo-dGTP diphosphatase
MPDAPVLTVAAALITDDQGRYLLVRKRGTTAFMQAGGKLEPGERPDAALVREVAEELALRVQLTDLRPLGVRDAPAANEPGHRITAHVFAVENVQGTAVPSAEIEEALWVDREQAAVLPLAPLTAQLLGLD